VRRLDTFNGNSQRPAPRRWSRRWDYDYANNLIREERDDNPFHWHRWQYDSAGRLLAQDGTLPGQEQWRWDAAGNPLEETDSLAVRHNRVTQLNGICWRYDIHGRTIEKDNGQTRWHYRYDGEHRLTDVISQPRERNKPQVQVSFRYDPLGRRISKTRSQTLNGQPQGRRVTTRFVWERFRLLQEIHDEVPLTYVYSDEGSYDPLARIDGSENPEIYWFHNQPNGTPERLTDAEGQLCWEGQNSAWGKLLRESSLQGPGFAQNLRMQGQYLDRETGLHYNLFRYYDPDCGRFTQPDPIGLLGGINLYQYAPNTLGWVDPWGLSRCKDPSKEATKWQGPHNKDYPGIDSYTNKVIKKGTILYALHPNGDQLPAYAVTHPTVRQYKGNPLGYHEALQVKLNPAFPVRTQVRAYYVSEDIYVATGRAKANPQWGNGKGLQFYIPEEARLKLIPGKVIYI